MNINFGKWQEEVIYDDHGGHYPCRTDYLTTFTISDVQFFVAFSDFSRTLHVYRDFNQGIKIYSDEQLTTDKAEELIKDTFLKSSSFQKYSKEKMFAHLGELNKSLYQKLLAETGD